MAGRKRGFFGRNELLSSRRPGHGWSWPPAPPPAFFPREITAKGAPRDSNRKSTQVQWAIRPSAGSGCRRVDTTRRSASAGGPSWALAGGQGTALAKGVHQVTHRQLVCPTLPRCTMLADLRYVSPPDHENRDYSECAPCWSSPEIGSAAPSFSSAPTLTTVIDRFSQTHSRALSPPPHTMTPRPAQPY